MLNITGKIYGSAALALGLMLATGCGKKETAPQVEVEVQAQHPEVGPMAAHITADAVLAPLTQAAIAPKISAPVKKFYVQRGSHVKAGQLLAVLENRDLEAAALDNQGSYKAAYDSAKKHLDSMQTVSREAALKAAQGQLESAKGKYLGAEAQVSYSEIRSPIHGVVTDRPLFAGETAAAGAPLLTVMDTSALLAKLHISQLLAQQLRIGDSATVTVPGMEDSVPAKVSLISPARDHRSTSIEVWVKTENKDGALKVGTPVHVAIQTKTVPDAVKVPASALLTAQDGGTSVMVMGADGVAHKKPVQVGIRDGEDVQILNGITPADMVITEGAYGLDDGTKVKLAAAAAKNGDEK